VTHPDLTPSFGKELTPSLGTFYIECEASIGRIARISFDSPLNLIDLTGDTASKPGIFDALGRPDHEWCQWFGCLIDQVIAGS
jgi:hypothetical protein